MKPHYPAETIRKLKLAALLSLIEIDTCLFYGEDPTHVYRNNVVPLLKKYGCKHMAWSEMNKIKKWCGYYHV